MYTFTFSNLTDRRRAFKILYSTDTKGLNLKHFILPFINELVTKGYITAWYVNETAINTPSPTKTKEVIMTELMMLMYS